MVAPSRLIRNSAINSFGPSSLASKFNHLLRPSFNGSSIFFPNHSTNNKLEKRTCKSQVFAMASNSAPEGYRRNVGVCLLNKENLVFIASRIEPAGAWQMPQGGVDENEEPAAAVLRELKEETGIVSANVIGEVPEWLTYDFPLDVKERLAKLWGTAWNGQAQKWFTGEESEINLLGDGSEKPEFDDWKWAKPEEVLKEVVEFKKPVYERVFEVLPSHL